MGAMPTLAVGMSCFPVFPDIPHDDKRGHGTGLRSENSSRLPNGSQSLAAQRLAATSLLLPPRWTPFGWEFRILVLGAAVADA